MREVHAEFARFSPKQLTAQAEWKYGIVLDLDLDMVRGALAELAAEGETEES